MSNLPSLELEPHGPDTYVGSSPAYPWGRIYGGLVVAQAQTAATATVDPEHHVHSLHSYFILGGVPTEPVRYEVDRIRNGRSFSTRRVVARQSSGAILNLSISFQIGEDEADVQIEGLPPGLPGPDDDAVVDDSWSSLLERRGVVLDDGRRGTWIRLRADLDLAWKDLDAVAKLVRRHGLRLFEADLALERTRCHLAAGDEDAARETLDTARELITDMDYGRRRPELADLEAELGDAGT